MSGPRGGPASVGCVQLPVPSPEGGGGMVCVSAGATATGSSGSRRPSFARDLLQPGLSPFSRAEQSALSCHVCFFTIFFFFFFKPGCALKGLLVVGFFFFLSQQLKWGH